MIKLEILSRDFLRRALGWLVFWIYNVIVLYAAIMPESEIPPVIGAVNDKLLHAIEYAGLFFVSVNIFEKAKALWISAHPYYQAFIWCFVMGMVTEWMQFYVPDRVTDAWDWLVDMAGALMGLLLYRLLVTMEGRWRLQRLPQRFSHVSNKSV